MVTPTPHRLTALLLASAVLACTTVPATAPEAPDGPVPGPATLSPFPIDRGDDGVTTPGTYKGLPLRLADNGRPVVTSVGGRIGVVCIGMSNSSQECGDYITRVAGEFAGEVNPAITVVNCAVGGHAIEKWIDPAFDSRLWDDCLDRRLPQAGLTAGQVRVIWHKAANQFTTAQGGGALPSFPAAGSDYEHFRNHLGAFAARVRSKFPAVQAVYTSSRTYGGYADNVGRGEPLSYEEGHALNTWLTGNAQVDGIWYGWGPYLWAPACGGGTNKANVCWDRADFVEDGVHPAASGRAKVSAMLHARWLRESWYARQGS